MLAGLPCADAGIVHVHKAAKHSDAENEPNAENAHSCDSEPGDDCSGQETDTCSPLCPCACIGCQGFSLNSPLSCPHPVHEHQLLNTAEFIVSQYQGYLPAIWQPPQ